MEVLFVIFMVVVVFSIKHASFLDELYYSYKSRKALPISFKNAITKYNSYYQKLPLESKKKFERKLLYFIESKDFIARSLQEVTDEQIALISSAAVQLTFGLPNITFMHFDKILVYPNDYYSTINRQYHKGEVNPRFKSIVLSWHPFVKT